MGPRLCMLTPNPDPHIVHANPMSPLESFIHEEIRARGPMTLARFMELALYHPEWGYYASPQATGKVGRKGDFFTSVSVGPLFGRLLARQFFDWWNDMGKPTPFHIVEAGGLDGRLAHDILQSLQQEFNECFQATRYVLVEPLPNLDVAQRDTLKSFPAVSWIQTLNELKPIEGIIFGNELLDAFPVHLLESSGNAAWNECRIALENNSLTWTRSPCPASLSAPLPSHAQGRTEVSPQATEWIEAAAKILKRGRILLVDYGLTDEEYFEIARPEGTLRGYRQHRLVENILAHPGEQDITAHVRWTPLLERAKKLNLQTEDFIQQSRWLTRIMAQNQIQLTPQEIRQFQTLTHPEMMGSPFRVLVFRA